MTKLVNRAKMTTTTVGTGTITLGSAVDGYQSFADAGLLDGDVVRYVIEDGIAWEIGTGTYTAAVTTLTRTPSESSNSGSAINLSGEAVIYVTAAAADLQQGAGSVSGRDPSLSGSIVVGKWPPNSGLFYGGQSVDAQDLLDYPGLNGNTATFFQFGGKFNFSPLGDQIITAYNTASGDPQTSFNQSFGSFPMNNYLQSGNISFGGAPWVGAASGFGTGVTIELPEATLVSHFLVICDQYNIKQTPLWIDGQQVVDGASTRLFTASNLPVAGFDRAAPLNNGGVAFKRYTFNFGAFRAPSVFFIGLYPAASSPPGEIINVVDSWTSKLPSLTTYQWFLKG